MYSTTAAVVERPGDPFTFSQVNLSEPGKDEVLVEMVAAGLCHSDLNVQAGKIPFTLPGVLGHEGAGIVRKVGSSVTKVQPGDKVLLSFTSCAHCDRCRNGHPAYCDTWLPRNVTGGARGSEDSPITREGVPIAARFFGQSSFAKAAIVDARSVVKVDNDDDLTLLAPLGCGVQTGFGTVWNVLAPRPGESLAVFGAGAVGLSAIMAAAALPAVEIIAVDRVPSRLELARELGARHTIDTSKADMVTAMADITGGRGIDNALDTTGIPFIVRVAVDALKTGGACAVVGVAPPGVDVALDMHDLLLGKRILGVTLGDGEPETLLPRLAALHREGKLPLEKLVKHYEFKDLNNAASDMHAGTTIKPVVLF
ncbi:NAD(P)-dependent alcohol dehydrogenase [Paenarthrobacter sp. A20]|uniref:NAD(P)-dependent alcohol dehydrogenase n=1 Tax=Paenarthrobacter sp. A20 TaxID=2817891 RepID=UPI00209D7AAB|nr:NAD(P)-dependent alcohol dehydrogenase [Paenarthrobacter sp. A20]MCP1415603.1 aryl-alcohol dehydrogenase [Paenarthrobacter sp. A20]